MAASTSTAAMAMSSASISAAMVISSASISTAAMAMSSAATAVMTPTVTAKIIDCTDLPDLLLDLGNAVDHIDCLLQPGPLLYIVWPLVAGVLLAILLCLCICCCVCMQIRKRIRKGHYKISNSEFRTHSHFLFAVSYIIMGL